jgi:hypothetical protein
MTTKTLQELEALKNRLESDINRSRMIDSGGLRKTDPLVRNFEQVKRDIAELKEGKENV